jgi:hypothetical protein
VITSFAPAGEGFALWPVAETERTWLHVDGEADLKVVGSVLGVLYTHSGGASARTVDEAVHELIGFDTLFAPGGLLLEDNSGVRAEPGCGGELFTWRTWLNTLHRAPVDTGQSPAPWVEYPADDVVRVWVAQGRELPHIDLARSDVPKMLRQVQRDLTAFLSTLRTWADIYAPTQGELLVAAVDAGLQITEPLPL